MLHRFCAKSLRNPTPSASPYPVGYQNKELAENANSFVAMTLHPIGVVGADVTLSQFVPTDGEEGWEFDTDYLFTIQPNGCADKMYGYVSPYWAEALEDKTLKGWHFYSNLQGEEYYGERCDNVKIPFGTGVGILTMMSNVSVTFAGEVLADDYGVPLNENANTFTGIVCPADIKLGDLTATDGEEGWEFDTDFLFTIKPNGCADQTYGWVSPYWAEALEDKTLEGWHLYSNLQSEEYYGERCDNVPLAAGQAIGVCTMMSGVELVVPSALP